MKRSRSGFVRLNFDRLEDRVNPGAVPVLNSLPGAPADIYLDYDGDTTTSTTAYDTDSNPADFSTSEQADITRAWGQIALYFAPFNVNVTTVLDTSKPKVWHISGNNISGGYSYVNVFPNTYPRSFNQSGDTRGRMSGIIHEVGHNFGLNHQSDYNNLGVKTVEYISAKEPLRGFLMGVDYNGTVKKFSLGHGSSPSALQDDLAVIAGDLDNYGGDGYRTDDIGNTIASATALTVNGSVQSATAIIERPTDVDYFSFTSTGGRVALTVAPDVPSALDAVLEVRNASNTVIAVADTVNNGQTLTMTLPAGTYYAAVSSKGNYADIGQYTLSVKEGAPEGFQTTNIGLTWFTGDTTYAEATDTWKVTGAGNDIAGTSDQFHYAWKYVTGDGTITARVTGMQNTNATAKAGVMIRDTLAANSRHVSAFNQFGNLPIHVARTSTGGSSSTAGGASGAFAARWVRITKTGNSLATQWSTNGTTWTNLSTSTLSTTSGFYIGLAVTAREANETNTADDLNTSTFTNVSITGFTDPSLTTNTLPAPQNVSATPGTGTAVNLTWDAVAGATGYRIERSIDNVTFIYNGASTTATYTDSSPTTSQRYWYRVQATDAAGRSAPSAADLVINRPAAVRNLEVTSLSTTQIVLDWWDGDGETGYRVERSDDAGSTWATLATVGKNVPSYTANSLTAATSYSFRVTPTSAVGDGSAITIIGSTRLPSVGTLSFGTIAATSVGLTWTDIAGETGYRVDRSTDGTTFTSLATLAANATSYTDTTAAASTEYYYRVVGTANGTESVTGNTAMVGTPPATAISGWLSADIGTGATTRGSSTLTGSTFTIISGGADIWGSADAFRFTYQQLTGNGSITARVATVEDTGAWAKIGVMIRESLAANSRHVHTFVSPANGVNTQSRSSTGGTSVSNFQLTGITAPEWVRMVRRGNVLTGYYSADGITWTQAGSVTLSGLAPTIFFGLSANANTTALLNTSTYDNVANFTNNVKTITVDDGTLQRSKVRSITVAFNGLVSLPANPASAFTVIKTGGGAQSFTVDTSTSTATQTIAKLTFTASTLADGLYTLTVLASQVTDASGLNLGTMAANVTQSFHRLFGDTNNDRTVGSADFLVFGNNFNTTNSIFDHDNNGVVDGADALQFGNRFGITL